MARTTKDGSPTNAPTRKLVATATTTLLTGFAAMFLGDRISPAVMTPEMADAASVLVSVAVGAFVGWLVPPAPGEGVARR